MKSSLFLAAVLLPATVLAAAPPVEPKPVLFGAQSRVVVDAGGAIVSVERPAGLPAAVADAIEAKIRTLHFEPARIDGRQVGGATYVQMQACAVPKDGNYALVVKYRGNGPGQDKNPPPRFPYAAMRSNVFASYRLLFDVQADGSVKLASLDRTQGGGRYAHDFEAELKAWVPQLHFLPEQVDAKAVPTRLQRDVDFRGGGGQTYSGPAAARRAIQREQAQAQAERIANSDVCQAAFAADEGGEERNIALNSPFKVQSAD
jgi:hypothetical protein